MRRSNKELKALIAEQERSGEGVPEFCANRGLHKGSFYVRKQRVRKESKSRFVEVGGSEIRLKLPGGLLLEVEEADLGKVLRELIRCGQ